MESSDNLTGLCIPLGVPEKLLFNRFFLLCLLIFVEHLLCARLCVNILQASSHLVFMKIRYRRHCHPQFLDEGAKAYRGKGAWPAGLYVNSSNGIFNH